MILSTLFGLSIGEFISCIGLIGTFTGCVLYVRTKLVELEVKVLDIIDRINQNEIKISETSSQLKTETDSINEKLDKKIDKISDKIDHIIDTINEIKIDNVKKENVKI